MISCKYENYLVILQTIENVLEKMALCPSRMKYKNKICILLTACVNPGGMSFTALQDVKIRERQYEEALDFYLNNTNVPIVFIENTGCDFSVKYHSYIQEGRLECLTFNGNDYDKKLGKGYGEYKILMYADSHSEILRSSQYVMKITGRIKVLNVNDLLCSKWLMLDHVFRCDFRDVDYLWSMVFIIETHRLMDIFRADGAKLNDTQGVYFEHILYEGLLKDKEVLAIPFFRSPDIDGICGTSNRPYSELVGNDNLDQNFKLVSKFYDASQRKNLKFFFLLMYKYFKCLKAK